MIEVRIYHPALDTHVTVPESAVSIHRASGWVPADEYTAPAAQGEQDSASDAPSAEEKKPIKAGSRRLAEEQ